MHQLLTYFRDKSTSLLDDLYCCWRVNFVVVLYGSKSLELCIAVGKDTKKEMAIRYLFIIYSCL